MKMTWLAVEKAAKPEVWHTPGSHAKSADLVPQFLTIQMRSQGRAGVG